MATLIKFVIISVLTLVLPPVGLILWLGVFWKSVKESIEEGEQHEAEKRDLKNKVDELRVKYQLSQMTARQYPNGHKEIDLMH